MVAGLGTGKSYQGAGERGSTCSQTELGGGTTWGEPANLRARFTLTRPSSPHPSHLPECNRLSTLDASSSATAARPLQVAVAGAARATAERGACGRGRAACSGVIERASQPEKPSSSPRLRLPARAALLKLSTPLFTPPAHAASNSRFIQGTRALSMNSCEYVWWTMTEDQRCDDAIVCGWAATMRSRREVASHVSVLPVSTLPNTAFSP